MEQRIMSYLETMVEDFSIGNDNEYEVGTLMEFEYEEIEKGDVDLYGEEEVDLFYKVREYIMEKECVKYKIRDIEYTFEVKENNILCRWIEPQWN